MERGEKIIIVVLALLLLFVLGAGLLTIFKIGSVTGRVVGKVYDEDISYNVSEETKAQEKSSRPVWKPHIFVAYELSPKGFYVRYYNDGNKSGMVCDCFAFGEAAEPSGWVYTKECVDISPLGDLTIELPHKEMDRMHRELFGKSLDHIKLFGASALGWCLRDQPIDTSWKRSTHKVPLAKADDVHACWEEDGGLLCRECTFNIDDPHPSNCTVVEREFKSSIR